MKSKEELTSCVFCGKTEPWRAVSIEVPRAWECQCVKNVKVSLLLVNAWLGRLGPTLTTDRRVLIPLFGSALHSRPPASPLTSIRHCSLAEACVVAGLRPNKQSMGQ